MEYIEVGYSLKSYGVYGTLKCVFLDHYLDDVAQANALFFLINGQFIPYFTETIHFDQFYKLKLETVNSKEESLPLHNKKIFLRSKDVKNIIANHNSPKWANYKILDLASGDEIGEIAEIHELPEQTLAEINYKGKTVYIPLHKDLIIKINDELKQIQMNLPDGLLDL